MLHRRTHFLSTTIIAATFALSFAGSALADNPTDSTSASSGGTVTTSSDTNKPATDTSTDKPATDTSTTKPPVNTSAPVTVTPAATVTEVPKTTTPPTTVVTETPETPEVPTETCSDAPDVATTGPCTPETTPLPNPIPTAIPDAPGGGDLPFTGPGDVVLAVVLALLAGTGGILFLFGASGREQLDRMNRRGMDSPSGFHLAYRELRKQQVER